MMVSFKKKDGDLENSDKAYMLVENSTKKKIIRNPKIKGELWSFNTWSHGT